MSMQKYDYKVSTSDSKIFDLQLPTATARIGGTLCKTTSEQ